jgi:hypothetical protein
MPSGDRDEDAAHLVGGADYAAVVEAVDEGAAQLGVLVLEGVGLARGGPAGVEFAGDEGGDGLQKALDVGYGVAFGEGELGGERAYDLLAKGEGDADEGQKRLLVGDLAFAKAGRKKGSSAILAEM